MLPRVCVMVLLVAHWPLSLFAALIGHNFEISGGGCRFPDVAYSSISRRYLVVWTDYNVTRVFGRFVSETGSLAGLPFPISELSYGALYPAIAYNALADEFLVTWDDTGGRGAVIFGQRVRGSDGTLMGTNFAIGSLAGGIRSAVAWSATNNIYLVAYWGPGSSAPEVYGQRISGNGTLLGGNFNISNDSPFSGYPAVAWAGAGNQFLVTWDNEDGNIHGRRINPSTGALLGSVIVVTAGGGKDRSCIAYDSVSDRWLVQFNNGANAGFSYDQYGQFVRTDGSLSGSVIPVAHTTAFEGDTQFGGDVCFAPIAGRFFSSFGTDTGMGGQELFVNGAPLGPQITLGTGYYTSLNNAADTQHNRFLTAWEGMAGNTFLVFGQLYAATLSPVTNFAATAYDSQNILSWKNPTDGHFAGTRIRVKMEGYPLDPEDGTLVADKIGTPGADESFAHTNLANWATYYYAAFAYDVGPNYSVARQSAATPRPPVIVLDSSDFNSGTNGWTLTTWAAGPLTPGTIMQEAASGAILSTGSGVSNNRDPCTREGSTMAKPISTAGQRSIQLEYDVMAALHAPPTGSSSGGCATLEGTSEDKLVISYSTTGPSGPWITAQVLTEGVDFPTDWTRKLLNFAGIPAVDNNPSFAVRFQWQFNHANDTGRVDNIRLLSGAVTSPSPCLGLSKSNIEHTIQAGQTLGSDIVYASNLGEGVLDLQVADDAGWLQVTPATSTSAGPPRVLSINYTSAGLPIGDYAANVQVSSANGCNAPQRIPVSLRVIAPVCFREPFDYYNGNLTLMGGANWSGVASNQLMNVNGTLNVVGGGGLVSAAHSLSCTGSNGIIAAEMKIRRGNGSGDFFWNVALDDASGNNLARWYGSSTIARGRIGGTITPDMVLTGGEVWDDLYLRMNVMADTVEFFFNGISFGSISHGSVPGNAVGLVRLERLDRSSATSDTIYFDNFTVGPADNTPPRLRFERDTNAVVMSWPATGAGIELQSTAELTLPITWTPVTNGLSFGNGERIYRATTAGRMFYRLRRM